MSSTLSPTDYDCLEIQQQYNDINNRWEVADEEWDNENSSARLFERSRIKALAGVFFRKYTEEQGKKLGVVGWVKNTARGTVTGQVQGPKEKVEIMKNWLRNVGSPMSRIDRAVFSNERPLADLEFQSFATKY